MYLGPDLCGWRSFRCLEYAEIHHKYQVPKYSIIICKTWITLSNHQNCTIFSIRIIACNFIIRKLLIVKGVVSRNAFELIFSEPIRYFFLFKIMKNIYRLKKKLFLPCISKNYNILAWKSYSCGICNLKMFLIFSKLIWIVKTNII